MDRREFVKLSSLALAGLGTAGSKVLANSYRNLPPTLIQDDLIAELHFIEGWNQWVFNRVDPAVYPNPLNLIGVYSEQFRQNVGIAPLPWGLTGAALTDFFANDPNGNLEASRLVMGGGSSQLMFYTLTLAAVPHTFSVYVKSNTGLSQAVRIGNGVAPSADKTVTTSWTRIETTFTPSAGSVLASILNDTAHDPLDILIWGAQLEVSSGPAGTYVPWNLTHLLGVQVNDTANDPTWDSTGLAYGAGKFTHGISSVPLTFSHITLYGVFKKTGADAPGFFEPILTSETSNYSIIMESRDILNSGVAHDSTGPCFGFGFTNHIVNAAGIFLDANYHVFCGTYDGTNIRLYWDGTQVEQKAHTISSQTIHRLYSGMFESNSNATANYFPGSIGMLALYDVAHTVDEVRQNSVAMFGDMACRGVPMSQPSRFIGVEGDSIPAGLGITQGQRWAYLLAGAITPTIPQWNDAVGGSTVANCAARAPVFNQAINPSTPFNLLIVELGANDMAGGGTAVAFVANLKAYCLAQYAAGWSHIAIVPVLNRGDDAGFDARRLAANSLIAADPSFYDVLITLDPIIMAAAAVNDPTLFQADKVHPTAFSNLTYLFPGIQTGITPLLP